MNAGTCSLDADDHSYSCDCQRGYRGDRCEENIDECYENPNICLNGGTCEDLHGSYRCVCVRRRVVRTHGSEDVRKGLIALASARTC